MTTYTDYTDFLQSKITVSDRTGFEVADSDLSPLLFPHQRDIARWALSCGKALIAASFGLGKSRIQLDMARLVVSRFGGIALLVAPLGVKHQFQQEDAPAMGMSIEYVRTDDEIIEASKHTPYLITNYERIRDGNINPKRHNVQFGSLDEGSVLRSLGSKTYWVFMDAFANVPYRFVCTATPSPNRYKELIHYAQFLGVMDTGQALTRWFKRDSQKAGNLTIHPHHEKEFWLWVSSWAVFIYKPSDLGHDDTGYDLPQFHVHWHRVESDYSRAQKETDNRGQFRLLPNAVGDLRSGQKEVASTIGVRLNRAIDIMAEKPDAHWLLWHYREDERTAIEKRLPDATTVYGSPPLEKREQAILDFSHGKIQTLATKPEIAGSGCNFQRHCSDAIFLTVDPNYRFEDFIQAVHRIYRFQQSKPVNIHIIYTENQDDVVRVMKEKWNRHNDLSRRMQVIVQEHGLTAHAISRTLSRQMGVGRMEIEGTFFRSINNDCVAEVEHLEDGSVGLIHTSIPFGNHYEYSSQYEDFGHNTDNARFWQQMDFLIPELFRVLQPGRIAAIHVKDRIRYGNMNDSGVMCLDPFSDECVAAFRKHGFVLLSRRTILTDVVRENNQTYRLGWTEMSKDASKMGSGLPEYLLVFRKPPTDTSNSYADVPVTKNKDEYTRARWQIDAHALWRSNGAMLYDHEQHVARLEALDDKGNLPSSFFVEPPASNSEFVWDDIVYMRTLNTAQSLRKRENHICPLPLDIVERTIELYSNKGDVVLDPFAGLHTVPYVAIKKGRYGLGIELNSEYWRYGVEYCQQAEAKRAAPTLFGLEEVA